MAPPTPPTQPTRDRDREPPQHPRALRIDRSHAENPPAPLDDRAAALPLTVGERNIEGLGTATQPCPPHETPFAWQDGHRLLLLDEERSGWTFAELRFDDARCRYVEVRRATFRWPREAAGAILARGLGFGPDGVERLAVALDGWLVLHLAAGAGENVPQA